MDKQSAIEFVGVDRYRQDCEQARAAARRLDSGWDQQIAHDIFGYIWESDLQTSQKLQLIFDVYDDMPCYAYVMLLDLEVRDLGGNELDQFWTWFRDRVSSDDDAQSSPVTYSLAVDFFADADHRIREVWSRLDVIGLSRSGIKNVLAVSGPVPFDLKLELYVALIDIPSWHPHIFRSIQMSKFDMYGQVDDEQALTVLDQLDIPSDTEGLMHLRNGLEREARTRRRRLG